MSNEIEQIILDRLGRIEDKLEQISTHGCAKFEGHKIIKSQQDGLFDRVRIIEKAQAEGRGKLMVAMLLVGAIIAGSMAMLFRWIGTHIMVQG